MTDPEHTHNRPNPSITEAADAMCAMREWLPGCEELVARFTIGDQPLEMVITRNSDIEIFSGGQLVPMKDIAR